MKTVPILLRAVGSLFIGALACACANIGNPSGGPRDEDPPVFLGANPPAESLNVTRNRIVLSFNELINVKDAFQKVVVSPVGKSAPRVSSLGKRVTVEFDSLMPNTTYTVDFADAIEDNNEANRLQGFAYTFSTGPQLDTLRISGRVLAARNLEPQQGMLVGVTQNLSDSAFTALPFLRVAKTDDRGQFVIRGLAPGQYRVFALSDRDNDYRYSNPEEDLAFYPLTVSPSTESVLALDSVWDPATGKLDTVTERTRTRFLPNDLLLRSFNSEKRTQYLAKYERLDSTRIFLKFNTLSDRLPSVRVTGADDDTPIGTLESSQRLDSLVYWLRPELMRTDSLTLSVNYLRTDSTGRLAAVTDTLKFFHHRAPAKKNKRERKRNITAADSLAAITFQWKPSVSGTQEANRPIIIEAPVPLAYLDTAAIRLETTADSVYRPVKVTPRIMRRDSLSPRHLVLEYPWDYGAKYRLSIDSLAAMDIYGKTALPLSQEFTVKKADEYCSLTFRLSGLDPGIPAFVELLNSSDSPVRTVPVEDGTAFFPFLAPGKYYARVIEDNNGNGIYDTGNYELGLQPELAYYYPKAINIKKNWDKEEQWDVFATAIDMQKPAAVLKNKPDTGRNRRNSGAATEEEEEDEIFDPTRNPFDPNDNGRRRTTAGSY